MIHVLLWPFRMVWGLIGIIFLAVGKLFTMLLGLGLVALGIVLTASLVGIAAGIPLIVFGALLALRSLF